eukprot:Transcript_19275.p4 GENE.Transcript_19275~~Transcript_19275.p4  ORF type:complete len:92 (-),score=9.68 Transcript_19275:66-341(-)
MAEGAKHPEEQGLLYDVLSISSAGRLELTIPDRGCSGCFDRNGASETGPATVAAGERAPRAPRGSWPGRSKGVEALPLCRAGACPAAAVGS